MKEYNTVNAEVYLIHSFLTVPDTYGTKLISVPAELFTNFRKVFLKLQNAFRQKGREGIIEVVADEDIKKFLHQYPFEGFVPADYLFEMNLDTVKKAGKRRLIANVFERAQNDEIELSELIEELRKIELLLTGANIKLTIADEAEEFLKEIKEEPIRFRLLDIEAYPADLILITARTKSGKTTLALNLILDILNSKEEIVLTENDEDIQPCAKTFYVTYEVSKRRLFEFLVGIHTGKSWKEITREDKEEFIRKFGRNIAIKEGLELSEILNFVWIFKPTVFVIDYDQLVLAKGRFDNEERRIAHIVRNLKDVATKTGSICILLSQVNEEGQARYSREKEHAASVHIHLEKDENSDLITYEIKLNRWGRAGKQETLSVNWETRKIEKRSSVFKGA